MEKYIDSKIAQQLKQMTLKFFNTIVNYLLEADTKRRKFTYSFSY